MPYIDFIKLSKPIKNLKEDKPVHISLENENIPNGASFILEDCTFEENVNLFDFNILDGIIKFENCTFKKSLFLYKHKNIFEITFEKCCTENIIIQECQCIEINVVNSSVSDSLVIVDCKSEELYINTSKEEKNINEIDLKSKEIELCVIKTNDQIGKLALRGFQKLELTGNLDELEIDTNSFEYLNYTNLSAKEFNTLKLFQIDNQYITGSILLEDIYIKELTLNNVTSTESSVRFNQLKIEKAEFENVNIDSFIWNQVHFCKKLIITRCNFNQLQYSNIQWLKGKKVSESFLDVKVPLFYGLSKKEVFDKDELSDLRYERETYKQFKAAALTNHLNIEALDFYRNEMRLYWKEIRIAGGIPIQNRILVFVNRWSSDFGQNWLLPIGWLFLFHLLWFSCLHSFGFWSNTTKGGEEFAEYFKLLNPTHEVPAYVSTGFGYLTDIIMRVSVAYFVYHIIRATRKYGKV